MKYFAFVLLLAFVLVLPASALEISAPQVPESGRDLMPEESETFSEGLRKVLKGAVKRFRPDLAEASESCLCVIVVALVSGLTASFSESVKRSAELVGTVTIAALLLDSAHSLISLGTQTITELSKYGKLLLPVMTSAMAAQGQVTSSTALYAGTAALNAFLTTLLIKLMIPMLYCFLALATASAALGNEMLTRLRERVKAVMLWTIKTIITVFTAYLGITGVVSGTTDAATLKATKFTISGVVPVVGGILSDASEAVLVSAGVVKNAAGIYGILAILAVLVTPFLRIGVQYLMLKLTGAFCAVFGSKALSAITEDFGSIMGLLLAMAGSISLLLLVSTVCFLRGVG